MIMNNKIISACGTIVCIVFALFVWPTLYRYDHMTTGPSTVPVKINRITGTGYYFAFGRWITYEPEDKIIDPYKVNHNERKETRPAQQAQQQTQKYNVQLDIDDPWKPNKQQKSQYEERLGKLDFPDPFEQTGERLAHQTQRGGGMFYDAQGNVLGKGGKLQKNVFEISFPDGWVEIPRYAIDSYEKAIAELVPNGRAQHYDYGFQMVGSRAWLEHPYILIQVKNSGRLSMSQLKKIEGYSIQEPLDQEKTNYSAIADIQTGKIVYDSKNKLFWMLAEFNVNNAGQVSGLSGIVPTEKGSIQVHAYCAKNDYPAYEPIFRSIAASVTPNPELAYKTRWHDSLPPTITGINWGKILGKTLALVIIGGIVTLIMNRRRKKNQGTHDQLIR